ncbi:hypothetical protein Tco_1179619, partial [Tanacetum coccineum]
VKTVNGVRQLRALIDKKKIIITESSIRSDLHLDDAEGTDCLANTIIFEELAKIGYEKPSQNLTFYKAFFSPQWKFMIHTITQSLSAKSTAWNEFSSTMASLIICLATNRIFNLSKYIFDAMVKHLDGGVKFLIYPHFLQVFINQQLGGMTHHKKIFFNPSHIKNIFANMKREGKDFSGRITPLFDTILKKQKSKRKQRNEAEVANDEIEQEDSVPTPANDPLPSAEDSMQLNDLMVGAQKDASKQGRSIEDIDTNSEVTLVNETQEQQNEDLMFNTGVLDDNEVFVDVTSGEKDEQSTKLDDITAGEVVTTAGVKDSAAPTIQVSTGDIGGVTTAKIDELNLAQALIEIKSAKPKVVITTATTTTTTRPKARGVVVKEPSEFRTSSEAQPSISKDKGKAIMIEPEVPLKSKDQVALDEDPAREIQAKLDAEIIEEEKLARKKEEEANIALIESWDNIQAMIEADFKLAQKLQTEEQGEITIEERSKLFVELMNKRKKHFAMLRAEEKRRKPQTKAQKRNQISTNLKNMGGYKHNQLKRFKSYLIMK